ncbi:hypothetical protein ACEOHC_003943 [Salmonella enterica]
MIKTMLERLLGHLHRAVFDTTADEVVAFRLDGPAGSSWVAKDENFDITFADGSGVHFDLNNYAMYQFIPALTAAGMTVTDINPDTRNFSGITMLELSGTAGSSQPVTLYKDILHAVFGAYSREMRQAKTAVMDGIDQLYIPKADDGFLDTWGQMFGVPRGSQTDTDYRNYIPAETFRLRVNGYAIEQAVKDQTGYEITLEEPWQNIFRLDESRLSGSDKFYNMGDVGYFIVQPVTYTGADWDVVMPIIKRNLAAGVVVLDPQARGRFWVNDPLYGGDILWQVWTMWSTWVRTDMMPRLDETLVLSGGYSFDVNYPVAITSTWMLHNLQDPLKGTIWYVPGHNLSYFATAGVQPIGTNFTGTAAVEFIELYPTDPRNWMNGGWEPDSTWDMPYQWKAYMRASFTEDSFFGNAGGVGVGVTMDSIQGETWEDPTEWGDIRWDHGASPSFYILAAPSIPSMHDKFTTVSRGPHSTIELEQNLKGASIRVVFTRYSDVNDKAVSGGMADMVGVNSNDSVATFTQETASKYAFIMKPVSVGRTTFDVTHPDAPGVRLTLNVNIVP